MKKLKQALDDYLLWMISSGYADKTIGNYQQVLEDLLDLLELPDLLVQQVILVQQVLQVILGLLVQQDQQDQQVLQE